jgi:predicted dehydrogenase
MRFGLIGTGYWAAETHATALSAHPDVDFVGVWGRSPAKTEHVARRFSVRAYAEPNAMFAEVDAVAFAVPPDVQAALAISAAEHGCHLLLDKPVALTTADADAVVDAVDRNGVRSVVFFTARFVPNIREWLTATAASDIWHSARIRLWTSIFEPDNPFADSTWRRERGALWDIGPHALALAIPMLGPVEEVVAVTGLGDAVELGVRHASGATSSLALSLTAPFGSRGEEAIFYGASGQVRPPEPSCTYLEAMGHCTSALISASWKHPCDASFGRDVVAVLENAEIFLAGRRANS